MVSSMMIMAIIVILLGLGSQVIGIKIVMLVTGIGILASEFPAFISLRKLKKIDIERMSKMDRFRIYERHKKLSDNVMWITLIVDTLIIIGFLVSS